MWANERTRPRFIDRIHSFSRESLIADRTGLDSTMFRGAGAGPAGTAAAGPMLEAKLMNLIKGQLQKF